ncbi:MAG: type I-C CRISPR-associated endonuclease Cas1c [Hyphomicrobiales bacterium]|nr:type I-C CRISPR-associated endonuclease Cas1c [Hyphomicrobiales bacterium]
MRRHLNTLYVTTQQSYLSKDGQNVVIKADGTQIGRVPIHTLGSVVCFGRVSMSPALMGFCAEQGVAIAYLSEHGRFLARVEGPVSGNVLLRREQYRLADDGARCATIVRSIVTGKTLNQRAVVRRALRDHGDRMDEAARARLERAEERLTQAARRTGKLQDTDALRGLEGEAAQLYFAVFDDLILGSQDAFSFQRRSRRPPLDPVNALLSFIYTLLLHDIRAALETVGLDPAVGFLHRDRPGRPSLALDLMEEFRPIVADRLVLSLINRKQAKAKAFRHMENGAVLMSDDLRKDVLVAYQERKRDQLMHPFLEERATVGLLWHLQAQLLARHLRGDLDGYPPFVWK